MNLRDDRRNSLIKRLNILFTRKENYLFSHLSYYFLLKGINCNLTDGKGGNSYTLVERLCLTVRSLEDVNTVLKRQIKTLARIRNKQFAFMPSHGKNCHYYCGSSATRTVLEVVQNCFSL